MCCCSMLSIFASTRVELRGANYLKAIAADTWASVLCYNPNLGLATPRAVTPGGRQTPKI